MWRRGALCDANIRVQSKSFAIHRNVLASASDFLCALFTSDMRDNTAPEISEMRAEVFGSSLKWMYTGKCSVDEEWLGELLEASTRLNLSALREAVIVAITERISAENALVCWEMGERLSCSALEAAAKAAMLSGFCAISKMVSFSETPADKLQSLLQDDSLSADEEAVFEAVVGWCVAECGFFLATNLSEHANGDAEARTATLAEMFVKRDPCSDRETIAL